MNVLRVRHLENALSHFEKSFTLAQAPHTSIDSHLRSYFRAHKTKLTAEDKDWLSEKFKDMIRWRGLIQNFSKESSTASDILRTYFGNGTWRHYSNSKTLPEHTRTSMPEGLFTRLCQSYGKEKSIEIGQIWNESSPTFVRVNPLIDDRERVLKFLASKGLSVEKTSTSDFGIRVVRNETFASLPELKEHVFDIQDESCQIIGQQVKVSPGDKVLDFCSGSGGKSLVFAPSLKGKGHLFLHDVNERYLTQARNKMRNSRIKNFSILAPGSPQLDLLKRKMDWIIVDVPSTGSGQFRRYPERKWMYSDAYLDRIVELQRSIFSDSLKYLKKRGKIVYSTSSVLPEENLEQVKYFCDKHKLYLVHEPVYSLPQSRGMDGFFSAVLERH